MESVGQPLSCHRLKSLLCVVLVLNVHVWLGGCAGWSGRVAPPGSLIRIELTPEHPISTALAGSAMAGATAVEIDPARGSIQFVYPGDNQRISAKYAIVQGRSVITEMTVARNGRAVALTLDAAKHITSIRSDDGLHWTRPAKWDSKASSSLGVRAFLNANTELMKVARADDEARGYSLPGRFVAVPGSGEVVDLSDVHLSEIKADAALVVPLPPVFAALAAVWAQLAGVLTALLAISIILSLLLNLLGGLGPPQVEPIPPTDGGGPGPSEPPTTDCDGNGVEDATDIADGTRGDCNSNGVPDSCDIDTGVAEDCDANGVPDGCEGDADGDGRIDACDACPADGAKTDPGACGCGVAETDTDGDGTADCLDGCPADPAKTDPGACGCGVPETDTDGDGAPDCIDLCPTDPNKVDPGACGCGVADTDTDGDGTPDCQDICETDPNKVDPGACGCGNAETDTDGDGAPDCIDLCPNDPNKVDPGSCDCGVPDEDSDGDGFLDCQDNCPMVPNLGQEDADMDGIGDACDTVACCLTDGTCADALETECAAMGGTSQGPGTDCATAICATALSDPDWVYENLANVTDCTAAFTATIGADPLGNDSYTFQWTIIPPPDRPGGMFTEVSGGTTATPVFAAPLRPAFSPSGAPYIVTVVVTGDDAGNVGRATFPIRVRLLGDVDGNGCLNTADMNIVVQVEDGVETDPEMVRAADVNCDGSADGHDRQIILFVMEEAGAGCL